MYLAICLVVLSLEFFLQLNRNEEEGSEETLDTESQQATTLSNDVYKQVCLAR